MSDEIVFEDNFLGKYFKSASGWDEGIGCTGIIFYDVLLKRNIGPFQKGKIVETVNIDYGALKCQISDQEKQIELDMEISLVE